MGSRLGQLKAQAPSDGTTPAAAPSGSRLSKLAPAPAAAPVESAPVSQPITQRIKSEIDAIKNETTFKSVAAEVPGVVKRGAVGFAQTFAPAISNFFKTTGGILGEGLAYAVDKNVREQYKAGNLEVLPTITETTQPKLAKATIAAGLETAVYRSFPNVVKAKLLQRGGIGAIQGIGFAVASGLADDKSAEEIVDTLAEYGISGAALTTISPYLLPILKAEMRAVPSEVVNMFKGLKNEIKPPPPRKLGVDAADVPEAPTRIAISTPNKRYEDYLRSQGYEPYIPDEKLPTIDMGPKPRTKSTLPEITPETPISAGPQKPARDRIADLPDEARKEVLQETRKLYGRGMDYKVAEETALARFESRQNEAQGPLRLVDEEVPASDVSASPVPISRETQTIAPAADTRVTRVPSEQLPVGTGEKQVSRLEARIKGVLDDVPPEKAQAAGITTYSQMNKRDQILKAIKFVDESPDEAMAVLRGEKVPPGGLLHNSIALALEQKAATNADANLAIKLASLRSTRAGQEISILTEADPSNPISHINEIIKARAGRVGRRLKSNETVEREVSRVQKEFREEVSTQQLKIDEADKILDEIMC